MVVEGLVPIGLGKIFDRPVALFSDGFGRMKLYLGLAGVGGKIAVLKL